MSEPIEEVYDALLTALEALLAVVELEEGE
jgi:hypothetical protein